MRSSAMKRKDLSIVWDDEGSLFLNDETENERTFRNNILLSSSESLLNSSAMSGFNCSKQFSLENTRNISKSKSSAYVMF
jgi:hypothetical protein